MLRRPAAPPVTSPEVDTTVAMPVEPEVHEPEGVASLRGVVDPEQTKVVPLMAAGAALTVTVLVALHPDEDVYVTVARPDVTPATIPEAEPMVTLLLAVLHVPPGEASDNVVLAPVQTMAVPVITGGRAFTVIGKVTVQPVPK